MKTTPNTPPPATPDFPGIVIDPESGRRCALQVDIFHGLKLSGAQVARCNPRIYQGRYYDIEDVIKARALQESAKEERRARRNRGMILTELASIFAATVAGTTVAAAILAATAEDTADSLRGAVDNREHTIRTMEELGFSGASEARRQWEETKPVAMAGIASLETLNPEN